MAERRICRSVLVGAPGGSGHAGEVVGGEPRVDVAHPYVLHLPAGELARDVVAPVAVVALRRPRRQVAHIALVVALVVVAKPHLSLLSVGKSQALLRRIPSMGIWDSRARNRRTDGATGGAKSHREKGRPLEELTFGQWLAQGGDYVVWLGAIAAGATGICALLYKGYRALTRPARDAAEKSEEGDRALHERRGRPGVQARGVRREAGERLREYQPAEEGVLAPRPSPRRCSPRASTSSSSIS